ncbi:uracil-xanthine permease family protein [Halobacterium litoreum]|uniref:Uracil-xanthine permease family protein n=1 Tax=Halobacterium litoreum TaxID=2039234 RepID=A0ABD5NHG3_9EURY|nr:nucleobase:cation symporter-2 family protein [Halobacterium litoreum]UHH12335.1 purine permease [Halobacterium litoreum]
MATDSSEGSGPSSGPRIAYGIEEQPPLPKATLLGVQHVLAMFLGNVAPAIIIAGALGALSGQTAYLVQVALVVAGAATIVQAYPIGPVGARLPIVMGTSFPFVGAIIGIGNTYGLAAVFGACLVGALVESTIGFSFGRVKQFFPPLVNGIVVMLIGLTLIPVGMDYLAGGAGAADYGAIENLALGGLVLAVTLALNQLFDGFLRIASVFVGIVAGYLAAIPLGMVDFSAVQSAGWLALPELLPYGVAFEPGAIVTVTFLYVTTAMETIGDISGTTSAVGRDATEDELKGGLIADGVMSAVGSLVGAFPNTSFSQNVGLVNLTGVASRHVVAIGGAFLLVLGFVPKVGAVVSAMPAPVLGGGALLVFSMIFSSGVRIIYDDVALTHRNMTIVATSIGLGLAVKLRPEALAQLPQDAQLFFGSGLITGGFAALILNVVLPEDAPLSDRTAADTTVSADD